MSRVITERQQAFINSLNDQEKQEALNRFICDRLFYADVIETGSGFSVGSSEDLSQPDSKAFPCLHLEQYKAQEEVDEMINAYQMDFERGKRCVDDEYEGVVMAIHWDEHDNLHFHDIETEAVFGTESVTDAMGF